MPSQGQQSAKRYVEQKVKERQPDGTFKEVPVRMEVEAMPRQDGSAGVIPLGAIGTEIDNASAAKSPANPEPKTPK